MDRRTVVGAGRRVLVAQAAVAEPLVRDDFAAAGFDVVGVAHDGPGAVELAMRLRPDVVIVDAALPRLDGISVTGRIAAQGVGPVVMVLTASDADLVDQAIDAGAMAALVEPGPASVVAAADMVLARQADNISLLAATLEADRRGEHRELIERAKNLLMTHLRLTEAAAARWLHRTALEGRTSTMKVATIVVDFWSHRPVVSRRPVLRSVVSARPALYSC
ncbi:ANTAR domain-containing response regulator [Nakamurella sp. GG22]